MIDDDKMLDGALRKVGYLSAWPRTNKKNRLFHILFSHTYIICSDCISKNSTIGTQTATQVSFFSHTVDAKVCTQQTSLPWKLVRSHHTLLTRCCFRLFCSYVSLYWFICARAIDEEKLTFTLFSIAIYPVCASETHEMFEAKISISFVGKMQQRKKGNEPIRKTCWLRFQSNRSISIAILLWAFQTCLMCCNKAFNLIWYLANSGWHSSKLFAKTGSISVSKFDASMRELAPIFLFVCIEYICTYSSSSSSSQQTIHAESLDEQKTETVLVHASATPNRFIVCEAWSHRRFDNLFTMNSLCMYCCCCRRCCCVFNMNYKYIHITYSVFSLHLLAYIKSLTYHQNKKRINSHFSNRIESSAAQPHNFIISGPTLCIQMIIPSICYTCVCMYNSVLVGKIFANDATKYSISCSVYAFSLSQWLLAMAFLLNIFITIRLFYQFLFCVIDARSIWQCIKWYRIKDRKHSFL